VAVCIEPEASLQAELAIALVPCLQKKGLAIEAIGTICEFLFLEKRT